MSDDHERSNASEELDVPEEPPDPEETGHVLPDEELRYPDLAFDAEGLDPATGFALSRDLDREEMDEWLEDLAGALSSHDLGVTALDGHVVFGVAPEGVEVDYEPEETGERTGELAVSFRLRTKVMVQSDDPEEKTGARAGSGFVPLAALTDNDRTFRCYNWVGDPFDPLGESSDDDVK